MALASKLETFRMTEAEYLKAEHISEIKHEFIDGYVYAMTGASTNHIRVAGNIYRKFGNHLEGKTCEVFMADMKVNIGKDYVYPDVLVDCTPMSGNDYYLKSPVLIVEVLSKSTRRLDLTTKLIKYINLPSLQEYVLIEQDSVSIQILRKRNHWQSEYYFIGDSVTFEAIDLTLTVESIYERVDNEDMQEFRMSGQ